MIYYTYIHTYILGHYNPSVRIIGLVSRTTYIVCVNVIHKWRDLEFKVELQFFFLRNFSFFFFKEEITEEILVVFDFRHKAMVRALANTLPRLNLKQFFSEKDIKGLDFWKKKDQK